MLQLTPITQRSKEGLVYEPANRYIKQQGISIYTPIRRHDLYVLRKIDWLLNILLGPSESALPLPYVFYVDAGILGAYSHNKSKVYAYPITYTGIGATLQHHATGYHIVSLKRNGPAETAGLKTGDVLTHYLKNKHWKPFASLPLSSLRLLFREKKEIKVKTLSRLTPVSLTSAPVTMAVLLPC